MIFDFRRSYAILEILGSMLHLGLKGSRTSYVNPQNSFFHIAEAIQCGFVFILICKLILP